MYENNHRFITEFLLPGAIISGGSGKLLLRLEANLGRPPQLASILFKASRAHEGTVTLPHGGVTCFIGSWADGQPET